MTETTLRPIDGNGHTPDTPLEPRKWCPYSRHLSKITWRYSIELSYEDFTEVIDGIIDLWDRVEELPGGCPEIIADEFIAIIDRIQSMQAWTGWGGVPGIYTTVAANAPEPAGWEER